MQGAPASETHFSNTCAFCKIIRSEEIDWAYDKIYHVNNEILLGRAISRQ